MTFENLLAILAVITVTVFLFIASQYFLIWLQALFTGTHIRMLDLVLMSLRKVDPKTVVQCKVMAVQAGLSDVTTAGIEAQMLAGGNVMRITLALIAAHRAAIPLDWNTAAVIDLAGRDILEAVQLSVNPKVIDCPASVPGKSATVDGVAKDGIQLKVQVRVTVRTNVEQLIGGATEATVIARVGEGVVSAIGACDTYLQAVIDPLLITREVMSKGLDSQTAFSILSLDISDITVGRNIGSQLQISQAEADIRIANANAEKRRAAAVAREQEMIALTRENEAAVVLAEALIPEAMATAWRCGQLNASEQPQSASADQTSPTRPAQLAIHRAVFRPSVGNGLLR